MLTNGNYLADAWRFYSAIVPFVTEARRRLFARAVRIFKRLI